MNPSSDRAIQHAASTWYVRLQNPQLPASERIAFRRWLDSDPRHLEAFQAVETLWQQLREPAQQMAASGWHRPSRRAGYWRQAQRPALATACCLLAVMAVGLWRDPGIWQRATADYASAPGVQQQLTLADGSQVLLDADSALDVQLSTTRREVHLLRGRAWFDVQHDAQRPFIVHSPQLSTRVLGTAFAVDSSGAEPSVTVMRGRVEVQAKGSGQRFSVEPEQQVRLHAGQLSTPLAVDSGRALAWQRGLLLFDRAPLGEVLDSLQRISGTRVILLDESLRQQRLSGAFRANDPAALLEALTTSLQLKTRRIPGLALLIYR
ncbi:MAG: FecR family protein [Pseudomonas sp.]